MPKWVLSSAQVLVVVLSAAVGSIVMLAAVRAGVGVEALRAAESAIGGYAQVLGTIYAVLLAFVVFVVWTQFNDCRAAVEREANETIDLYRTVSGLPAQVYEPMQALLRDYVDNVIEVEWPAMAKCDDVAMRKGASILDRVWELLRHHDPSCHRDETLYAEALARFNDLSDTRTNRITASRNRIPFAMRLLIYGGALMNVGSMCLLSVTSAGMHAFLTAALGGAISHIVYIVEDLDHCFSGDWRIDTTAFERARRAMIPIEIPVEIPIEIPIETAQRPS